MENILLIDTSDLRTTIAYMQSDDLIFDETSDGYKHAERIDALVENLFQEYALHISDVDCVAVVAGPGSYTGLRIGVAFAKGLALALNIPLLAIDSLEALARSTNYGSGELVISTMDPGRDELFYAIIDARGALILPATYCKLHELNSDFLPQAKSGYVITGSGALKLCILLGLNFVGKPNDFISSYGIYYCARRLIREGIFADAINLEPLYLKNYFFKVARN